MLTFSTRQAIASAALLATLALPVVAQSPTPSPTPKPKKVDLACMQSVVEKRDNAIIAAFDTFSTSMKTAFTARRDTLKATWGISERAQRRSALKNAWHTFRTARRTAVRTYRTARHNTWRQFRTDRKTCRSASAAEEPANEASDLTI